LSELAAAKIECVESKDKYARFFAEPLEQGFGVTLGNALRRVLLSKLYGAAVTQVSIEGIQHEFSPIPHIKEDTMELLLNLKALRLKALSGRPGTLILKKKGEGIVHASDIQPSNDFEIANPELCLATLDSNKSSIYMEMGVELGRGYKQAESGENMVVGAIPVDAIFSPVRKVNYSIEAIHRGTETSLERLVLEVWTDGTISPADAISQAANIAIDQLRPFSGSAEALLAGEEEETIGKVSEEKYNMSVEQLDLSVRTINCLRHAGISTVGEVLAHGEKELLSLRNFGQKSLTELNEKLEQIDVKMGGEEGDEEEEPTEE